MKVLLKRFGQEVDLEDPSRVRHTLVFEVGNRELSLPVSEETVKALMAAVYASPPKPEEKLKAVEEPPLSEEDLQQAETFGGDEPPDLVEVGVDGHCPNCNREGFVNGTLCAHCGFWDGPKDEDEVGSL